MVPTQRIRLSRPGRAMIEFMDRARVARRRYVRGDRAVRAASDLQPGETHAIIYRPATAGGWTQQK